MHVTTTSYPWKKDAAMVLCDRYSTQISGTSYFSFMKKWISNNRLYFAGVITGGIAGFLYWKFVGCINGTCVITSHPLRSTIYFAVMGALIFGIFKKEKKKLNNISEQR